MFVVRVYLKPAIPCGMARSSKMTCGERMTSGCGEDLMIVTTLVISAGMLAIQHNSSHAK